MRRRDALQLLGSAAASAWITPVSADAAIPFAVAGNGPALLTLKPHGGDQALLTERYRVAVLDYPTAELLNARDGWAAFTPDRVCSDILGVADAMGVQSFAFYGYSWGGVVGLQLATRTPRVSALAIGGWPPLGAPYAAMPNGTAERTLYSYFYDSLVNWPERQAVARIRCPRMAFAGSNDIIRAAHVTARIGPLVAEHRVELERLGWIVRLVDGFAHELGFRPDVVAPLIRPFLDAAKL
jgi:pimeloyl-ACP methyl ester carboxylesterase